ncbi:NUDIX hydrolase [Halococcus hamelinensis]|uniref:NUDIX hydrolase n=1 Tax=Halococcus hamelinensis 100A6 TaxID=1132509 RepID=M0LQG4_9EURY|nr:NUDIX hydrolase [Halococcus hamelinensis]EMA35721.1 NUDIX hydrolase [Halococcus hamelinensis 100A6]
MSDENGVPQAWETLTTETAYDCSAFEVVHESVRLPDGTETGFDTVREPEAVVVLAFTPDDEVVVIEEWRQAVGRTNRGLPAGTLEPDEDPKTAAKRELTEETGYVAGRVEPLTTVEPSNGLANSVHHHFVAHDCRPTGERNLDADESIRVETADYDDLLSALAVDDLRDGRSALCLLYYDRFEGSER